LVYKNSELKLIQLQNPWHISGADMHMFFLEHNVRSLHRHNP